MKRKHFLAYSHQCSSAIPRENYYKNQCRSTLSRDNSCHKNYNKKLPSRWPIYGVISTLAVACYLNGIEGDFVHDDIPAVTLNKDVLALNSIENVFKNDFWGTPMDDVDSHKSYRPLTVLTFRVNYVLFGLTPVAFHLTNILLHTVACVLFTRVSLSIAGLKPQFATLAGLMFSCHPIHTEAVTGIVGRADVLACVLFLLSLLFYHGDFSDGKPQIWLSIVMGGMTILAKETGITVFLVNVGYDFYLHWPFIRRTVVDVRWNLETRDFSNRALKMIISAVTLLALRLAILQGSLPRFSEQDNPATFHSSIYVRFFTFSYLAAFNWWLLLNPSTLSHDWQMGSVPLVSSISDTRNMTTCFFFGLLVMLIIKCLCDFKSSRHSPLVLGVLLLVLPFLPASNLLITVGFVVAERVLYIPSLGYILLVVYGIQTVWQHWVKQRQTIVCFITLLLVSSCLRTVVRNKDWKSRESLLRAGLQTLPHNAKMHYNYANFLRDSSRHELAKTHYYMALKLWPTYASAHNNLGTILNNKYEAERHFLAAIKYYSNHVNAHYNLGQLYRKNNRTSKSEQMLKRCIEMDPNFTPAYIELVKLRGPNHSSVMGLLRKVANLNSRDPYYSMKFADYLYKKGNYNSALNNYWSSIRFSNGADSILRKSVVGTFKILRKFGQKSRIFQLLTRWHYLLRKNWKMNIRSDIYLQEWQLKIELSTRIKTFLSNVYEKNNSANTQNEHSTLKKPKSSKVSKDNEGTNTLDFSKFALFSFC